MPCGVTTCSINDDRFLWKCEFCRKQYHAACVGVQRQREEFITAFMVPLCATCQVILRKEADVRKMLHQQEQLVDAIRSQTDANQRIAADLKKFALVAELFSSIEHLLTGVKQTLAATNDNNNNICSAVGQHIKSCDSYINTAMTGIKESNSMSEKNYNHFNERLDSLTNEIKLSLKNDEPSLPQYPISNDVKLREILEEVKFVSGAVSTLQMKSAEKPQLNHTSLEEELSENSHGSTTGGQTKNDHTSPGWRFLGNKWHWKQDWSKFDAKQRSRRLQEKAVERARRDKKRRKQQLAKNTNRNAHHAPKQNHAHAPFHHGPAAPVHDRHHAHAAPAYHNITGNFQTNRTTGSDKQLLATAKVQFSHPPPNTDHPIAALSAPKFINFMQGETLNPCRTESQAHQAMVNESPRTETAASSIHQQANPTPPGWSLDPMRPPIVSMTQQSANGDGRFLKARLRDPKIMYIVRLYLAYLHDKDPSFCHEGLTNTSVKINLASEGLPTSVAELRKIFIEVHQEYGVSHQAAADDLESYRRHLNNQRIQHLQRIRESSDKFYNPNFRK